jgi:CRP-like cAMP-binding protein
MNEFEVINNYVKVRRSFGSGEIVFQENEEFGEVFIILEGEIRIKKSASKGWVAVARLKKGDVLGEARLFDPESDRRSITAVAEGEVVVGLLDHYRLTTDLYAFDPRLRSMMRILARRLRWITAEAASLARESKKN